MTEEQQKKELEIALTSYIALKHNQDECSGFIDGFKEALSLFAVVGQSEQLFCTFCGINPIKEACKHSKVCATKEKRKAK